MLDNFGNEDNEEFDDFFDAEEIESALEKYQLWKESGSYYFKEEEIEALSYHFFVEGKRAEQLEILQHGLLLYPSNIDIMIEMANYHTMKNENDQALEILLKAKTIAPYDASIANLEGVVLTELKQFDEAEYAFDRALENIEDEDDDLEIEVYINYAQSLSMAGHRTKAVRIIEQGINKYPKSEMLYNQMGLNFIESNDFTKAIEYFKRKVDDEPFNDNYWHQLGKYLEISGQDSEALNAYDYAGLINEKADNAFFSKAGILESRLDYVKAIESYKACVRSDGDVYPYICIARCYLAINDSKLARFYLKKAQFYGDFIPEYQYLLGYSYLIEREPLIALPYFKRLIRTDDKDFASYKALMACYAELDKKKDLEAIVKKLKKSQRDLYFENWRGIASIFYLSEFVDLFAEILGEVRALKIYDQELEIVMKVIRYDQQPSQQHKEEIIKCMIDNFDDTVESVRTFCPELFINDEYFKLNYNLYKSDNNDEQ